VPKVVDIQTVSIAIASGSVVLAAIYYVLQLRHQTRMRETDFIVRLYSTYGSKEFHDMVMEIQSLQFNDYEDFEKKYGPWFSKGPAQTAIYVVATYLSEVGVLLHRKIIDINFFYDIFGSTAISVNWEKVKPIILGIREQFHNPSVFSPFEYLYNEVKKREQRGVNSG
jgi:hypothetical protein